MSLMQWFLLIIAIAGIAVLGFFVGVTLIEGAQARRAGTMDPYASPIAPASMTGAQTARTRAAVIYFSRSGNTALAARHVARRLDADIYSLQVPEYALGLTGLAHSALGANARRNDPTQLPNVTPRTLDLTPFATVWLGSPVWFYSPAPPLWAFVEHNRFDGQHVVLFNTFNSNFGDDQIAAFQSKVMERGAMSFEHKHVLRGRMTQQLTPEQMLQAIDADWFGTQVRVRP